MQICDARVGEETRGSGHVAYDVTTMKLSWKLPSNFCCYVPYIR